MNGERRMHRRRSSAGDDGDSLIVVTPPADPPAMGPPPRTRVQSSPQPPRHQRNASISGLPLNMAPPPTAGPYRTAYPASPFRNSFGHSRTLSFSSSPFSPTSPSPLATSTSFADQMEATPPAPVLPASHRADTPACTRAICLSSSLGRVRFPQHTIDEDGAQELEVPRSFGAGFTFGKTPPGEEPMPPPAAPPLTPSTSATRRGHHHKHSVSHTFFSFLEPQSSESQSLVTQPTPTPMSPWMPISPFVSETLISQPQQPAVEERLERRTSPTPFLATASAQFFLGGTLWVQGQQTGSLAVTALGYWAVFDAIGVAIPHITLMVSKPYAAARARPVLLFAQSVYLMFSAVYVCKEAFEHLLLSASAGDGHHHHAGDEVAGIDFPVFTTLLALLSLTLTALMLDNHAGLVALAGNRIPPLSTLLTKTSAYTPPDPSAPPVRALSNPYSLTPVLLALGILVTAIVTPATQHRMLDLAAASAGSAATFMVAYRACTVLGAILLQTAPRRGMRGGRMEAFLRAMRDVERHPQVLHLPAPHIWQLAAMAATGEKGGTGKEEDALVVTLELHVRASLPDDDVLALTRWVRERVVSALGVAGDAARQEAEVTVGIVRG
ncbi:hypothetical protein MSAN_01035900 [Mycena sanguinolenta]|uniref:Zinc transporter 6 n=1 Tax=Mycena sanguinolenta TaxID=230812 RepID=A0A8H6YS19_9AGAR|nr:hypothetical protein MSAN_01035900 [Mycena sanguinolenta]